MSKHWRLGFTAAWFLGLVAVGATSCAVAPPEPESNSAPAGAVQPREAALSASSRHGMGALARAVQAAEGTSLYTAPSIGVCNQADLNEDNDEVGDSTSLSYASVWDNPPECWEWENCDETSCWPEQECDEYSSAWTGMVQGTICKNDEDWFLLQTASLPFTVAYVGLRAMAAGASHCPFYDYGDGDTSGYDPPESPENTLKVEVYKATTLELVASSTSSVGRVWMNLGGADNLSHDLYLRFRGPEEAKYSYHFSVSPQTDWFEDECEN